MVQKITDLRKGHRRSHGSPRRSKNNQYHIRNTYTKKKTARTSNECARDQPRKLRKHTDLALQWVVGTNGIFPRRGSTISCIDSVSSRRKLKTTSGGREAVHNHADERRLSRQTDQTTSYRRNRLVGWLAETGEAGTHPERSGSLNRFGGGLVDRGDNVADDDRTGGLSSITERSRACARGDPQGALF